jgi:heavy metal translocating P-type ATPase
MTRLVDPEINRDPSAPETDGTREGPTPQLSLTRAPTLSPAEATHESLSVTSAVSSWPARLFAAVRTYPLPVVALALLLVSLGLWLAGQQTIASWILIAIIVMGGVPLLWETAQQLWRRELGVDLIAILAIGGSLALQEYFAGAIVVLMLSGGKALEAFALQRASKSLTALAERAPRSAHIWRDGELRDIPADEVEPGMRLVVKPGEMAPVDGVTLSGSSSVSEADLTGEPLPVRKEAGSFVLSGSLNLDNPLELRALKRSAESQYAQILRLVREARERKAPIHRLADRYGVWFTALALALAGGAWAVSGDSVIALAVLVVATPCPLILATPIAIMSGIDRAAHKGIIAKSGAAIEQLGEVDVAVFDKTGTLTLGMPEVVEIVLHADAEAPRPERDPDTLLALAAAVEQFSPHILARAVVDAARERHLPLAPPSEVEEIPGKGVRGRVALTGVGEAEAGTATTYEVAIGNRTYFRHLGITLAPELLAEREQRTARGQIGSFIALDGRLAGMLVFADVPRPELAELTPQLKAAGIREVVLLSGDGQEVAERVGRLAGVDRVVAQALPEQKVEVVRDLERQRHRVLMVGDGINDAPALATARLGLAFGTQWLTAGSAAADAVLLSPNILQVAEAVRLGRRVMRVATEGIWIGMGLSIVAMIFAAFGFIPPAMGAILQEGIDVLVILNALRAGRT